MTGKSARRWGTDSGFADVTSTQGYRVGREQGRPRRLSPGVGRANPQNHPTELRICVRQRDPISPPGNGFSQNLGYPPVHTIVDGQVKIGTGARKSPPTWAFTQNQRADSDRRDDRI
jgi:hypothetical protein